MSNNGKVFGFIVGTALGGPIGAGLGTFVGALFDDNERRTSLPNGQWVQAQDGELLVQCPSCCKASMVSEEGSDWNCPGCNSPFICNITSEDLETTRKHKEVIRNEYIGVISSFYIMGVLAKSDGVVSQEEIDFTSKVIDEFNMKDELRLDCKRAFRDGKDSTEYQYFAKTFLNVYAGDSEALLNFIVDLIRLSMSDGTFSEREKVIISDIALNIFGVKEEFYLNLCESLLGERGGRASDSNSYAKSLATLGCTADSTRSEVKKAYRELSLKYHPDRIASKDLPEEFSKFAQDKFVEIKDAYDLVIESLDRVAA